MALSPECLPPLNEINSIDLKRLEYLEGEIDMHIDVEKSLRDHHSRHAMYEKASGIFRLGNSRIVSCSLNHGTDIPPVLQIALRRSYLEAGWDDVQFEYIKRDGEEWLWYVTLTHH